LVISASVLGGYIEVYINCKLLKYTKAKQ
jgi:hypothetical protein